MIDKIEITPDIESYDLSYFGLEETFLVIDGKEIYIDSPIDIFYIKSIDDFKQSNGYYILVSIDSETGEIEKLELNENQYLEVKSILTNKDITFKEG